MQRTFSLASCVIAVGTITSFALAIPQAGNQSTPLEAATASRADTPAAIEPAQADPDAQRVLALLTGSFASAAAGDLPALTLNSAPIAVAGLTGAVYFEIGRADAPADAFRSGVFHVYKRRGNELRLRVFDLVGVGTMRDALVGMYLAPQSFPPIAIDGLDPNVDIALSESAGAFSGKSVSPSPSTRDGAIEMTTSVRLATDSIAFDDRGFDADGAQVWGNTGEGGITFKRVAAPAASVQTSTEGLVMITMVPPKEGAEKLIEGGQIAVHYSGYLTNGTRFDSSRQPGREPFQIRIPGGVIKGWNEGLKGIAKGERRRLVIPPALAYGERGAGRGLIPPNSTLIFDIECLHVDNSNPVVPPPPTPPPQPANPVNPNSPPPSGATGTPNPGAGGQIGNPPAGSGPERPK